MLDTLRTCGGMPGARRSRSRVSFHIAAKVSFLESGDGGAATGPSTATNSSTPEKEPSNPSGANAGSQGGSSAAGSSGAGSSGGYISTAAGQLCHMQVMRGSIVGVPLPQQSPEAIAGQVLGKGDSSRSERGPSASGDTTQGGEMSGETVC